MGVGADQFTDDDRLCGALRHLVSPPAPSRHLGNTQFKRDSIETNCYLIISETGRTVVLVGLAILALPEDATVLLVRECSKQSWAMLCRDGRLNFCPGPAFDQVELGALQGRLVS